MSDFETVRAIFEGRGAARGLSGVGGVDLPGGGSYYAGRFQRVTLPEPGAGRARALALALEASRQAAGPSAGGGPTLVRSPDADAGELAIDLGTAEDSLDIPAVDVRVDGGADLGGQRLGLTADEVAVAWLPHTPPPDDGSDAWVVVQVSVPGGEEAWTEAGRLRSGQRLLTIGAHPLDAAIVPSLGEPAMLAVAVDAAGQALALLHPAYSATHRVVTTDQGGVSIQSVVRLRDGATLAHLILWRADQIGAEPVAPARARPRTLVTEAFSDRVLTLSERGVLLQKVHFPKFMEGYDVYLGRRGELATTVREVAAVFQVRVDGVSLAVASHGVVVGGRAVRRGDVVPLVGTVFLEVQGQRYEVRDLRGVQLPGWPYVAEIRRASSSTSMLWGRPYVIGRSREARVVLPDVPDNHNIAWRPELRDSGTIRTGKGEIEKSRFYTDSIMVATEHVALDLSADQAVVRGLARDCYAYVRRGVEIRVIAPKRVDEGPHAATLLPGDELLVGNCVLHIAYAATAASSQSATVVTAPPVLVLPSFEALGAGPVDEADMDAPMRRRSDPAPVGPAAVVPVQTSPVATAGVKAPRPRPGLPAMTSDTDVAPAPRMRPRRPPSVSDVPDARGLEAPPRLPAELPPPRFEPVAAPQKQDDAMLPDELELLEDDALTEPLAGLADEVLLDEDAGLPSQPPSLQPSVPALTADPPAPAADAPPRAPVAAADPRPSVDAAGRVAIVDEAAVRLDLARPARLLRAGWIVVGTVRVGNHDGCEVVIPETRIDDGQTFTANDHVTLRVRGASAQVVSVGVDARMGAAPATVGPLDEAAALGVVRRDDTGAEDFVVRLRLQDDAALPDPRARLLALDLSVPQVVALGVVGLPTGVARPVALDGFSGSALVSEDGSLTLSGYLEGYRDAAAPGGFRSWLVAQGAAFTTLPEDGRPLVIQPGDRLAIGSAVWVYQRR
jgi:hypothetical protein